MAITIERWSTDQEHQMLLETLRDKGQKEMVAALGKLPRVGFIRLANTRGYDLHYARETRNTDGSRRVVVAADRVLQFHEVVGGTRSQNYDFGFVELHFPASGKGEGKLAPANLISIDKVTNQIEIENYGTQPIRLMSVTSKTP
ncbi:MAG: hypothetical protein ACRD1P_09475 [Thermoanaerobaculia bacterium]